MKKLLMKLSEWIEKYRSYTKPHLSEKESIQKQLQESLSRLKKLCGEDKLEGVTTLQGFKNAWNTQADALLLTQVSTFLQAAQFAYKSVEGEHNIIWITGDVKDVEGTLVLDASADVYHPSTDEQVNNFFVSVPLADALDGDFALISNNLIADLQQVRAQEQQQNETDVVQGVTIH